MPDQIFISYRRDDAAYVTGHINDRLREEFGDESIFTDVDRIDLGVDFRTTLDQMVSECQILLAVIGEHWLTVRNRDGGLRLQDPADFVRIEIESALQRNIPVIPLLVEGTKMPPKDDLPDSIQDFAFRNGTKIRPAPDFHTDIDRLIHSLRKHVQALPKETEDEKRGHTASEQGPKDELEQERMLAEARLQRETDEERTGHSQVEVRLEEGEKTRHQVELGTRHHTTKKRWAAPLWMIGLLLLAGASWTFVAQNQEQVQAVIAALVATLQTTAGDEAELKADAAAEAKREADAIAEAKREADAIAEAKREADAIAEAKREADAIARAKLRADAIAEAEREADAIAEAKREADAIARAKLRAAANAEARLKADAAAFIGEGVRRAALGDHEAAIQNFAEAIRLNAEPAFIHKQRGASYHALGDYEAAIMDFDEAIRLNAEDANAYYNRSASHKALGNLEAAERDLTIAAELNAKWNDAR